MIPSLLRSSLASTLLRRREAKTAVTSAAASLALLHLRSFSAAAAEASSSPSFSTSSSTSSTTTTAKGVNYLKAGSDPVIPSTLPEWISEVSSPPATAFELRRALEQSRSSSPKEGDENGNNESLTGSLGARGTKKLLKLEARAKIKDRNSMKAKK